MTNLYCHGQCIQWQNEPCPHLHPWAPRAKAAATPRHLHPTCRITGMLTVSTTWGTNAMVVSSPICPPACSFYDYSINPILSILWARATDGTTGITLILVHVILGYLDLAPVIQQLPSCTATSITSSANGDSSIILTPKGLSVLA